jgi:hypothetical protein
MQRTTFMTANQVFKQLVEGFGETEERPALTKEEKLFLGDPGRRPVKIGDVVVRTKDLGRYIQHLAKDVPVQGANSSEV